MKDEKNLLPRTKAFALRIINLANSLPNNIAGRAIGNQIIRSGTSVAANYRAAQRARSTKEFNAKIRIVLEESDETLFWIEILQDSKLLKPNLLESIKKEADELTAIFCTISKKSSKQRRIEK
ncbi:MAG: four helix bundle protein [Rickettsiales bacterium]|jgi:four helix bundle protein|nr:four helix bundle protein [Rickettsiales bacterium]